MMYNPSTACVEKEGRVEDDSWTNTLVPGALDGVAISHLKFRVGRGAHYVGAVW